MAGGIKPPAIRSDCRIIVVASSVANFLKKSEKTSAAEGDTYYDTTLNQLRTHDGSSWSPAGMNSAVAGSWNTVMGIGAIVTTDNAAEIQISGATSPLFTLDANSTTNVDILDISSAAGTGDLIALAQSGTGKDILGSGSTWDVTRLGVGTFAGLGLADSKNLSFGDSGDITIDYVDGGTPGTAGKGLLFAQTVSDDNIQFGDATRSFDVLFIGDTATTNFMQWDQNGGAGSVGALVFDNADIDLGDSDLIRFGDTADFTLGLTGGSPDNLILLGSGKQFTLGADGEGFDIYWYTEATSAYVYFDETNSLVDFIHTELDLDDDSILRFGSSNDITMQFGGADFNIDGANADTVIKIGATNNQDLVIYGATITNLITFTTADATLECIFDNFDLRFKDDDYALFGNSASAGGTTDGTIRWDNTGEVLEIIGVTQFEDNVTMDGNLTLSGTLTMSGALAPGSIALGDTETLTFGDGTDYTISTAGSTAGLIITAANANDQVIIGDGTVATDFVIDNITVGGADVWWDQSADSANGAWYFGKNDAGVDVFFYGATASAAIQWDTSADQLVIGDSGASVDFQDSTLLLFGTGSSNAGDFSISSDGTSLFIKEVAANGAGVEFGVNNKGLDVKFFGETASVFMEWTQASDALIFDNADIEMGDGDIIVLGDGTDFSISATGTTVTTTLAAGSIWNISDTDHASSKVTFGVTSGSEGLDVQFNTITAADDMIFDAASKTFTLTDVALVHSYADDTVLYTTIVDSSDFLTLTATDAAAAKYIIGSSSGTHSIDFVLQSGAAGDNITFDGQGKTLTFTDCSAVFDYDDGTISYTVSVDSSDFLNINGDDGGQLILGANGTHGMDIYINSITSGEDIIFDAGAKTLTFDNIDIVLSDADLISFGDAGADGSIQSDGTNIDVTITAAMTLGDGGTSNYTNIAPDGEITLLGTAKVTKNHQLPLITGGGDATVSAITGAPSIDFNASDEICYASFQTPNDWDGASDLSIVMMVKNQIAETDGDDVSFTLTVKGIADGESHTDTGQTVSILQDLTGGDEGQDYVNKCTGTIDWNDGSHPIAAGDTVIIKAVVNLGAGTECTGPLHIIDWWIEYTADSLGTAT